MTVFRIEKKKDYTVMSNHHLRNKELSLKAKGLFSVILSLPDDWDYTVKGLAYICKEGADSIRKAVIAHQTNGNGYGILSPIAQNAIRYYRDILLRPDYYKQTEEKLRVLLADLMIEVQNGKDYNTAYDEARIMLYKAANASFNPDADMVGDFCYWNIPPVDSADFTIARKLLNEAQNTYLQK